MNDYFCVLPFFSVELSHKLNKNIYCCRLSQNTDITEVQKSILNFERSPNCSACWQLEDQGLPSERQIHNSTFDFYSDCDIDKIEQDVRSGNYGPQIIKLATSNLCNGTCITCGSTSSSAWAALENQPIQYEIINDTHISHINWAKIVQLSFVGGEPLLEKRNFKILQNLIDLGNTNCFISLVTNGSLEITERQLEILSKFTNLNICVSIDGTDQIFEYTRYPLQWSVLLKNLQSFKSITSNLSVSCMISNLNIFYYDNIIDFFKQQDLSYLCKQIEYPDIYAPGNLPEEFKELVIKQNPKYANEVTGFLSYGTYSVQKFKDFCDEISRQDQLKNISIDNYLPELATFKI
jgi:MoaA/NifB/PqqE/SkfB family radical SAM enzyme